MADVLRRFGEVRARHSRVVVCCQGPSWADVEPSDLCGALQAGAVPIFVNGAIETAGNILDYCLPPDSAAYWFTLDHSAENRRRWERPYGHVRYFVAAPEHLLGGLPEHVTPLRRVTGEGVEPDGRPFRERVWEQIPGGLAEEPDRIHTGNSGFGALGLAYHMRPDRVALLGVDGRGTRRWDGTRNRYLGHMPRLFETAVPQLEERGVEVVNGSPESAVDCFPRVEPSAALEWLCRT